MSFSIIGLNEDKKAPIFALTKGSIEASWTTCAYTIFLQ